LTRRGKTKRQAEAAHAKRRALQRFGLTLNSDQLQALSRMIRAGRSECIERESNRVSVHRLEWQGCVVVVVYDRLRKQIVTFLNDRR